MPISKKSFQDDLQYLNLAAFTNCKLKRDPFEYMVMPDLIVKSMIDSVEKDFPEIEHDGSFPLSAVKGGVHFDNFIKELKSESFRKAVEKKFDIDLANRPVMITARGRCKESNGKIHVDSKGKIITILVYLNKHWDSEGGKLRLLRNNYDLEDYVEEVTPLAGTLIMFKCTDNAWHGHKPFSGVRKSIQLNWVIDESYLDHERRRHAFSAWVKGTLHKLKNLFS